MVAMGVFYPVVINTMSGVRQIDKIYLDVGTNFRASRWKTFRTIALPGALPSIMSGIKLGIGMGLILIAIAEMVGAKTGIGFMIWDAWQVLSVETMYVGLIVISILGFLLTIVLNEVESWILPWKKDR
jgi:NitT/TauT family transport system permease protein